MADYVISDLHLNHTNSWQLFKLDDGSPMRPFNSDEEMTDTIINNINRVVKENDRLYILGDVVINKKHIHHMERVNCKQRILCGGNHDSHYELLAPHFTKILGAIEYKGSILTHIPVHTSQLRRYKYNIHGHLHAERVKLQHNDKDMKFHDLRYFNVSVEQLNYTPIKLDDVFTHLENGTRP